ncbi:MAG: AmmeMemoRadiSam system radical SAM enzyme [Deltaproteobacteria bacterium]|nr:AmmeMemoRadiSam system radical SAM enzyme [Deltaproteobacteria bacterium]MBW2138666.1 AmmeMemoRadiSam system radical SAM enzyme [Deltaproteobacteria bacterium]
MKPALLYKTMGKGLVRCHLCQRLCRIAPGEKGYCGTRKNLGGKLFSVIYGRVSSVRISPIEIKPLFHFYPGSQWLSMGSLGCNLLCPGCQNWEIAHAEVEEGLHNLQLISPEESVRLAKEGNCKGISWTYNEPTLWFEYTLDTAKMAREQGLLTNYVTNAYMTLKALDRIGPYLDAFRADLKGFSSQTYERIANISKVRGILRVLERARHFWGMHVEIVTNIMPTINDQESELKQMAKWIHDSLGPETPWHVTRFFPHFRLAHLCPTSVGMLERAREIGLEVGLSYVYLGNAPGHPAEDTYCPSCKKLLIERMNYRLVKYRMSANRCKYCGHAIAGCFETTSL